MSSRLDEFRAYRERMNERIFSIDHLGIKRFFNWTAHLLGRRAGWAHQELLGLVARLCCAATTASTTI